MVDDYVIVGAGSAGCVLANRLSEDPQVKVTLVEAGPPDTAPEIHIPVAFAQLFQTKWDWDYLTDPEPGLDGCRRYLPRRQDAGRLLLHECHDLHPRQPGRLHRLGGPGRHRLGLEWRA